MSDSTKNNSKKDFKISDYIGWIFLGITLWFLFPWIFSVLFNWIIKDPEYYGGNFGAVGDIYGSVNALFTSATLVIVIISTMMQRQANQDARDAMDRQLQQARDATAKQLRQARKAVQDQLKQAREAMEQQINNAKELAHLQLEQARLSTEQQLALAQKTHDAQIRESKYAVFTNMFNQLLNQRNITLDTINLAENNEINNSHLFYKLGGEFIQLIHDVYKDPNQFDTKKIKDKLSKYLVSYGGTNTYLKMNMYFSNYISILLLIKRSNFLEIEDRNHFLRIVENSMQIGEKLVLCWLATIENKFYDGLENTQLFDLQSAKEMIVFFREFGCKSFFYNEEMLNNWDKDFSQEDEETPQ